MLILTMLLHGAETYQRQWQTKQRSEAVHHRWLKKVLHTAWKDKNNKHKSKGVDRAGHVRKQLQRKKAQMAGTRTLYAR